MRSFSTSPVEMFASLWRNRELIKASATREVLGQDRCITSPIIRPKQESC